VAWYIAVKPKQTTSITIRAAKTMLSSFLFFMLSRFFLGDFRVGVLSVKGELVEFLCAVNKFKVYGVLADNGIVQSGGVTL